MHYYRARYYDGWLGRFISQDPIGFSAGDSNLYRYVSNSPISKTDPSGRQSIAPPPMPTPIPPRPPLPSPPVPRPPLPPPGILGRLPLVVIPFLIIPGGLLNPLPSNTGEDEFLQQDRFNTCSESKRCKLQYEIPVPTQGIKQCCYKCDDWRGALVCFPMQEGFGCPQEMDWWDPDEIPGALPLKG